MSASATSNSVTTLDTVNITMKIASSIKIKEIIALSESTKIPRVTVSTTVVLGDKIAPNKAPKDALAISDSASNNRVTVSTTVVLGDKIATGRSTQDTIEISEIESNGLARSLQEQLNLVDSAGTTAGFSRTVPEQFSISDVVTINSVKQIPHSGGGCVDCNPPSFSGIEFGEKEYSLSINGNNFKLNQFSNLIPTVTLMTGVPIQVKLQLYDNSGPTAIQHVALYTNLRGNAREIPNSDTDIIYEKDNPLEVKDPNGFFSKAMVQTAEKNNKFELTYDLIFAKPMEKSDVIFRVWDTNRNSVDSKILQAWEAQGSSLVNSQNNNTLITPEHNKTSQVIVSPGLTNSTEQNNKLLADIKMWSENSLPSISDRELLKDIDINAKQIPFWIKNIAHWVADGEISSQEFINVINYLYENTIIK